MRMMFEQGLTRDGEHKRLVLTTNPYNNMRAPF